MNVISRPLLEIRNLRALVDQHCASCDEPDCGVSTYVTKQTAERLLPELTDVDEHVEAVKTIGSWPL